MSIGRAGSAGGSRSGTLRGIRLLAESTRRLQLIVLTGDDRFAAHARTESLGFAAHLVKPVQLRDLVRLVEILVPWARGREG